MERSYADVVVIGAGPAGLVLTEVLARHGMSVVVVEKQSDPAHGPQGALLQPVTLDILRRLVSFAHAAEQDGAITAIEEYGPSGQVFSGAFGELADTPADHALNVTQGSLRRTLLERVATRASVTLRAGAEVKRVDSASVGDCRCVVAPVDGGGQEMSLESRWIVAADGKQSSTRALSGIDTHLERADYGLALVPVPTPRNYPRTIRAHRRPDGMATTVPGASPGLTYVFTHMADRTASPEQVVQWATRVVAAGDEVLGPVLAAEARPERTFRIEPQIVNAAAWRNDGVLLLGDSAHGMHNIGGQGLNTALQDALSLGDALLRHAEDGKTERIDGFIDRRRPFIDRIQDAQRRLGEAFWPQAGAESWFRPRFEELSLGQPEMRRDWRDIAAA